MTSMMKQSPAWVNDVNEVEVCLTSIERMMDRLQSMHAQRVGSVFGKDLEDMEGKIEHLTQEVTDQFRYADRLLRNVGDSTRDAGGQEATVGANVQRRYVRVCYSCWLVLECNAENSNLTGSASS